MGLQEELLISAAIISEDDFKSPAISIKYKQSTIEAYFDLIFFIK